MLARKSRDLPVDPTFKVSALRLSSNDSGDKSLSTTSLPSDSKTVSSKT